MIHRTSLILFFIISCTEEVVEETPTEEAPAEEAPVKETPTEEASDTSSEEKPEK